MNFSEKLEKIIKKNNSLLCIGLDTDLEKIPNYLLKEKDPSFTFNKEIIDKTYDLVCAYKPNIAFYEARGIDGLKSLKKTIEYLKSNFEIGRAHV
jgi:orotidine-5'-phosphate decarboxylase